MKEVNFLAFGAHLDDDAVVETIRYLGPISKKELNAIGVHTVGDLKERGIIEAYLQVKERGYPVNLNFVWAMFAGLMDVDFHKIPPEFKDAVKTQLESANQ